MSICAKPFIKWAGGKGSVVGRLNMLLPPEFDMWEDVSYIEPFVGGGAMLFNMLKTHHNIRKVIINDINPDLILVYRLVKDNPEALIESTLEYQNAYMECDLAGKEHFYYRSRDRFNNDDLNDVHRAALFLFLNHTCFNGLFRVNANGHFNVPFGHRVSACLDNPEVILDAHYVLNSVDCRILNPGDYKRVFRYLSRKGRNFIFLDPPYRPLSTTSYFKSYSNDPFGDKQQAELRLFCDRLSNKGCYFMLCDSDSRNLDGSSFFEALYEGYNFIRIDVPRYINAHGQDRRGIKEVLIRNY